MVLHLSAFATLVHYGVMFADRPGNEVWAIFAINSYGLSLQFLGIESFLDRRQNYRMIVASVKYFPYAVFSVWFAWWAITHSHFVMLIDSLLIALSLHYVVAGEIKPKA